MLNLQLKNEIRDYARNNIGAEICGLIILSNNEYKVFKCRNISYYHEDSSIISPIDFVKAERQGKIVAQFHSQENENTSITDNLTAFNHNLYSIIYSWKVDQFYIILPELKGYLFKDFNIGINDCFTLVRDYYKEELDILIENYSRNENWYIENPTYIYDCFKKNGQFIEINKNDIRKNDIILFGKDGNIGHLAIYQGKNLILHHPRNSKSVIEDMNHLWENKIRLIIRHKSL